MSGNAMCISSILKAQFGNCGLIKLKVRVWLVTGL